MPSLFSAKAVTRFLVTFAVLYGAAFTLYWSTPVFGLVHRVFIGTTTVALRFADGRVSYQLHLENNRLIPFTYRLENAVESLRAHCSNETVERKLRSFLEACVGG